MSKRFGRNQKRTLILQLNQKQSELSDIKRALFNKQHKEYKLHDVGLWVYCGTRMSYEIGTFELRAAIGEFNQARQICIREVQCTRNQQEFINYVAQHIAHDLVKFIGDKIRYV